MSSVRIAGPSVLAIESAFKLSTLLGFGPSN